MTAAATPPPTAAPGRERREQLRAHNAALRGQVDHHLTELTHRVDALARAQQQACAVTGTGRSADGLVRVLVNAQGVVLSTEIGDGAGRVRPEALGRSVVQAAQAAARDARQQVDAVLAPLARDTPDLAELVPGAPSLRDVLPPLPEPPTTPPARAAERTWDDAATGSLLRRVGR